jgi:4'-phosphopantetheinyl transferase
MDIHQQSGSELPHSKVFWLTQSLSDIPQDASWLSQAELAVLAGFRFTKRRDDWKLGRWTAKQAVCRYMLKDSPILSDLEIRAAEDGAPEAFMRGEPAGVSISISHSRQKSLCVLGPLGFEVGCDLEWIEPREERFAGDYFRAEEISTLQQFPAEEALLVNLIWSAKETVLKILRKGLTRDTRSVSIQPSFQGPEDSWKIWFGRCLESSRSFYGWWRNREGFIYTAASDQVTSAPEQLLVGSRQ